MEVYPVASSKLRDNKTMVSWKIFVENINSEVEYKEFDFSPISQLNNTVVCKKMDMTYEFYMKHNMHADEWNLNKLFNKDKKMINKLPITWVHPLNRKLGNYRV